VKVLTMNNFYKIIPFIGWEKIPDNHQKVEVDYGLETNSNIWFVDGEFVNKYGIKVYNVIGWR
jgi:imidazoleglycerol phosphate synthase glutamine amidotransferase subunit HisH